MFLSVKKRLDALLDVVDDMLVGAPESDRAADDRPAPAPHPHARTVSLRPQRRRGEVVAREMRCLCPVRPQARDERIGGLSR